MCSAVLAARVSGPRISRIVRPPPTNVGDADGCNLNEQEPRRFAKQSDNYLIIVRLYNDLVTFRLVQFVHHQPIYNSNPINKPSPTPQKKDGHVHHARGSPQTSQSVPLCTFSNVQCGHILIPPPLPEPPEPLAAPRDAASSAAIWSKTSGGISSSIIRSDDPLGAEVVGRDAGKFERNE